MQVKHMLKHLRVKIKLAYKTLHVTFGSILVSLINLEVKTDNKLIYENG